MGFLDDFMRGLARGLPAGLQRQQYRDYRYQQRMAREAGAEAVKKADIEQEEYEAELATAEKEYEMGQADLMSLLETFMRGEYTPGQPLMAPVPTGQRQPPGGFFPGQPDTFTMQELPTPEWAGTAITGGYEREIDPALTAAFEQGDIGNLQALMNVMSMSGVSPYPQEEEPEPEPGVDLEMIMNAIGFLQSGVPMEALTSIPGFEGLGEYAQEQPGIMDVGRSFEEQYTQEQEYRERMMEAELAPPPTRYQLGGTGEAPFAFNLGTGEIEFITPMGGVGGYSDGSVLSTSIAPARTDRHNNPTAMTDDFARMLGGVEGTDYMRGDSFGDEGRTYYTASLIGNGIETSIRMFDRGAQSGSIPGGVFSWWRGRGSIASMSDQEWLALSGAEKRAYLNTIYNYEQGANTSTGFVTLHGGGAEPERPEFYEESFDTYYGRESQNVETRATFDELELSVDERAAALYYEWTQEEQAAQDQWEYDNVYTERERLIYDYSMAVIEGGGTALDVEQNLRSGEDIELTAEEWQQLNESFGISREAPIDWPVSTEPTPLTDEEEQQAQGWVLTIALGAVSGASREELQSMVDEKTQSGEISQRVANRIMELLNKQTGTE